MNKSISKPLSERLRPGSISQVVGQSHLIGEGKFLNSIIKLGQPTSMILWGPPGSGKTTLARIIASSGDFEYHEISAVTTGLADVRKVIAGAKKLQQLNRQTILFVDEIHRFNKAQQDAFLPHIEDGTIIFLGATTQNPSFEVIGPLLSRSRVVVLEPLAINDIIKILKSAIKSLTPHTISPRAMELLAELSSGDARVAINGLEASASIAKKDITADNIKQAMQKTSIKYDKAGSYHYNLISAYIKSMRGGDVDATIYYLARMLKGGEDPKFIARRNIIFASEDIGIIAPAALTLAVSAFMAVERIGLPECNHCLFECAIVLAKSKKSRSVTDAMHNAFELVDAKPDLDVPIHLKNATTKLLKDLGYQKGTKWESGYVHPEGFMPKEIKNSKLYNE